MYLYIIHIHPCANAREHGARVRIEANNKSDESEVEASNTGNRKAQRCFGGNREEWDGALGTLDGEPR
jgi:hypothetical protein